MTRKDDYMSKNKEHFHGSDVEKVQEIYGIKKEDIINFAANVNPLGISPKLSRELSNNIDAITSYPDREYDSLRRCMGEYVNIDKDNILVANGSTELISLFIKITAPKNALILAPTYSEYEREIKIIGGNISYHVLDEKSDFNLDLNRLVCKLTNDIDMLIICNPNNPTSSAITREDMKLILNICKDKNIFVMVDETYVEFAKDSYEITSIPLVNDYDNIIVLRGVSKFYAAPGLRLGYAIANKSLIKEINNIKNPWSINSLAAIAGEIMFTNNDYINKTKNLILNEISRITSILDGWTNLKYYAPSANFILVKILNDNFNADDIFDEAIKHGCMIRNCSSFDYLSDKFIRICIMLPEQNDALLDILAGFLK